MCSCLMAMNWLCFFFQAEDGIRDLYVTGVQTCALPIFLLERELETWVTLHGPLQSFYMIDTGWRDRYWNGVTFDEQFTHFEMEMRPTRSEERRVGKECRSRWTAYQKRRM